jgi:hypothetical protein
MGIKRTVGSQDSRALAKRLSEDQAIEGIAVMEGQRTSGLPNGS